jgi:thymidylate synthase ThyX
MTATGITAEVVADSISPGGHRLHTQVVRFPRTIADELLTHRMFSRNARSSRATPVDKMIAEVAADPYVPIVWQRAQKGMQGGEEITGDEADDLRSLWLSACQEAVNHARTLLHVGKLHKTVPNRLLEPFAYQIMIVSGTDYAWQNFFNQRCHPAADPPMQALAYAMRDAGRASTPRPRAVGQWHLPFIRQDDINEITRDFPPQLWDKVLAQISAARCARVSYDNHAGIRSLDDDINLFRKLTQAEPPHASPLEHPARVVDVLNPAFSGNFGGDWAQLRHMPRPL